MKRILEQAKSRYSLEGCAFAPVSGHEGGRNRIVIVSRNGEKRYVLRISSLGDRSESDYLAETEFVRFLAKNGAPVADVIPSVQGRLVERVEADGKPAYVSLFACAKGMLMADNGYRYREGAPLSEYFYNTGRALGTIHRLSKAYAPVHPRPDYFDKYNMTSLDRLIPDEYGELKKAVARRLEAFRALPKDKACYGLVHFDFSDGNYGSRGRGKVYGTPSVSLWLTPPSGREAKRREIEKNRPPADWQGAFCGQSRDCPNSIGFS